ncbi:hypothetical protein GGR53DRAFT_466442 [Hypoxylon sp. FL1150]|nr:hypothetical protein GGR53DRAFT_466442 [Hypoxylon sp. FL1150]
MSDVPQQTAGDQKFSSVLFKYLPRSLEIEWDKFAQEMGFKDEAVARTRYGQIRRKMFGGLTAGGSSAKSKVTKSTPKKTANSGLKRASKASAAKYVGDEDGDDEEVAKGLKIVQDHLKEEDVKSEKP